MIDGILLEFVKHHGGRLPHPVLPLLIFPLNLLHPFSAVIIGSQFLLEPILNVLVHQAIGIHDLNRILIHLIYLLLEDNILGIEFAGRVLFVSYVDVSYRRGTV